MRLVDPRQQRPEELGRPILASIGPALIVGSQTP
jgi:hypothetical protein